ncbi:MAG: choice-of-anchor D domain-containing protein, partial [Pseudomonadota bacterium]|nr:choice-of-anchor D domain-containing protein [Pseudomonadota bacterium]
AVSFEATRVGSQSLPHDVRLVSTGSGVVTVSGLAIEGPYAIQGTTCPALPFALPAGGQCTVTLTFRPTNEGSTGGTLRVTSDAAPAERDVALSGTGEGDASVTGGGCSIGTGRSLLDPSLLLMLLLAATTLLVRAVRNWRARARGEARRQPMTDTEETSQ